MRLIESNVEIIKEDNPLKKIELAGRTCYKSESNITDDSAIRFVKNLIKNNHTAMLEHATFVFELINPSYDYDFSHYIPTKNPILCEINKFLNTTNITINSVSLKEQIITKKNRVLVSGNLRAINESGIEILLYALYNYNPALVYNEEFNLTFKPSTAEEVKKDCRIVNLNDYSGLTEKEYKAHTYTTMRFTCDRGVTHELVRHRLFSFAQESTRYCNYSKEKFGNGDLTFIKPANYDEWNESNKSIFTNYLETVENTYKSMSSNGLKPDNTRAILPNALKTEIVVTGNEEEWEHFFDLRSRGTTGKPNPDMKKVADMALELYYKKKIRRSKL